MRRRHAPAERTLMRPAVLLLLCGAVVAGIIGMHSFVENDDHHSTMQHASIDPVDSSQLHAAPSHEAGASAGTTDGDSLAAACGGAMLACLTILVTFGAFLLLRHGGRRRILWTRLSPFVFQLGQPQRAFQAIAPLHRSCVIRC